LVARRWAVSPLAHLCRSVGITALELYKGYAPYAKYAPMQVGALPMDARVHGAWAAPTLPPLPLTDVTERQVLIKTIREAPPTIKSYGEVPGVAPPSDRFQKFVARCLQKDPRLRCVCACVNAHMDAWDESLAATMAP